MPVSPKVDPDLVADWFVLNGFELTPAYASKLAYYMDYAQTPANYQKMIAKVKAEMPEKYGTKGKSKMASKPAAPSKNPPLVDPELVKKWWNITYGPDVKLTGDVLNDYYLKAYKNPKVYAKMEEIVAKHAAFGMAGVKKPKLKAPPTSSKNTEVVPDVVRQWYLITYGKWPTAAQLKIAVSDAKEDPLTYDIMKKTVHEDNTADMKPTPQEIAQATGATQPPPTAGANKPDMKIKAPTFAAQVKALLPTTGVKAGGKTIPSDKYDLEQKALYDTIKGLVAKKHKGVTWDGKYDADMKAVSTCVTKAPDAIAFLTSVIKLLDPKWKPWDQKTPLKPGQWAGLNEPDVPYSAKAQGMLPTPESQKKVELLTKKIADYEAEIKRLKDLQRDAEAKAGKAEREREKLATADPKLLKYFSYIDKNCSEFLEAVRNTGKLLYRGQHDASLPIFVGYPRNDREPKDSDKEAQRLADKYMTMCGFKALRSNSIFTSSNIGQADNYGDVYVIFPKNGFQYTWSTKHDDLVINSVGQLTGEDDEDEDDTAEDAYYEYESHFDNSGHLFYGDKTDLLHKIFDYRVKGFNDEDNKIQSQKAIALVKAFMAEPMFKVAKKYLKVWDDTDQYDNTADEIRKAFVDAIKPLLVLGKKYFDMFSSIADWDKNTIKNAEKDLKEIEGMAAKAAAEKGKLAGNKLSKEKAEAERIIKNFGFTHENFEAALKARHEICILGEYVAVSYEYEDELKKYFLKDAVDPKKKVVAKKKPAAKKKVAPKDEDDDENLDIDMEDGEF